MRTASWSTAPMLSLPVLLLALTTACSDSGSGLPLDASPPPSFALTPQQESGFAAALEDVRVRLLPALGAPEATGRLTTALEDLSLALSTRQGGLLRQALRQTEAALAALSGSGEEAVAVAVELDAVRLLLFEAEQVARPTPR